MIYLSGVSSPRLMAVLPRHDLGLMWTPKAYTAKQHVPGAHWAADNGCFTLGDAFDPVYWLGWLRTTDPAGCLFAVAPDVVGDAAATLERARPYFAEIRAAGYKVAFALQNGQQDLPVPWDAIDAVFIGGDDAWKLGEHAAGLVYQAKARGLWAHMGRVNSKKRLMRAAVMGCDSADGTFLRWHPDNIDRMQVWLDACTHSPVLPIE